MMTIIPCCCHTVSFKTFCNADDKIQSGFYNNVCLYPAVLANRYTPNAAASGNKITYRQALLNYLSFQS